MRATLPGLLTAIALGVAAQLAGPHLGLDGISLALAAGIAIANLLPLPPSLQPGLQFAEKRVLEIAVIVLGLSLDLGRLSGLGAAAGLIVLTIAVSILTARALGSLFGVPPGLAWLLGIGNGVCGTSAIAATAPLVSDQPSDVALSVGVVNLLGTIGIVIAPLVATTLGFSPEHAALFVGASLQAVGHVAAAAYAISPETGELALAVKMGRVAMLVPLVLGLSFLRRDRAPATAGKMPIPSYLIGFAVLAIAAAVLPIPAPVLATAKTAGKLIITVAMAGIGLRLQLRALAQQGPTALVVGALVFAAQLAVLAAVLLALG